MYCCTMRIRGKIGGTCHGGPSSSTANTTAGNNRAGPSITRLATLSTSNNGNSTGRRHTARSGPVARAKYLALTTGNRAVGILDQLSAAPLAAAATFATPEAFQLPHKLSQHQPIQVIRVA